MLGTHPYITRYNLEWLDISPALFLILLCKRESMAFTVIGYANFTCTIFYKVLPQLHGECQDWMTSLFYTLSLAFIKSLWSICSQLCFLSKTFCNWSMKNFSTFCFKIFFFIDLVNIMESFDEHKLFSSFSSCLLHYAQVCCTIFNNWYIETTIVCGEFLDTFFFFGSIFC